VTFALERIDEADERAALARVQALRAQHPDWTAAQLVEQLIKRKCQQAAAVGAATAGSGLIPGLGTLAALTVGTVADVGATLKLQTELVIEIAEVHGRRLSPDEKRQAMLLVGGLTLGSNRALSASGARLSLRLTERYAQQWLARAIPFAGVAASAGVNALSTYLVGRRAHAYFGIGPAAVGSWADSLRALTGVDERKLAAWIGDRTWRSSPAVHARARLAAAGQSVAGAARSTRRGLAAAPRQVRRLLPPRRGTPRRELPDAHGSQEEEESVDQ
jgi:hypothetical protein